jgi:hypothetical protein
MDTVEQCCIIISKLATNLSEFAIVALSPSGVLLVPCTRGLLLLDMLVLSLAAVGAMVLLLLLLVLVSLCALLVQGLALRLVLPVVELEVASPVALTRAQQGGHARNILVPVEQLAESQSLLWLHCDVREEAKGQESKRQERGKTQEGKRGEVEARGRKQEAGVKRQEARGVPR